MKLSDIGFTGLIPLHEVAQEEMFRVGAFVSLSADLDFYLKNTALDHRLEHLSTTSVIFHEDFVGLVGYITLANDAIKLVPTEINHLGLNCESQISTFPAVKICRLAIHKDLRGNGIGSRILDLGKR